MTTTKGGADFSIEDQYREPIVDPPQPIDPPSNGGQNDPPPDTGNSAGADFTSENAAKLGGVRFDDNGNLINEKGTISKAYAKVKAELAALTAAPNTDNGDDDGEIVYSINEAGDLVDAKGEVVRAKGTYTYDEKTGQVEYNEEPLSASLASKFREAGYQLVDDAGQLIEFPDTEEGIVQMVSTMANEHYQSVRQKEFEQFPELAKFYNHLANGGEPGAFYRERSTFTDYAKIDLPVEDKEGRTALIREYLSKVNNLKGSDLDEMLELIKTKGEIDQRYTRYLSELQNQQTAEFKAEQNAVLEVQKAQADQAKAYWTDVHNTIKSGAVGAVQIPDGEKEAFFSYLYKPVKEGKSQYMVDTETMTLEQILQLQYQVFKKLDLDVLVRTKVKQEQVDNLRNRMQSARKVTVSNAPKVRSADGRPGNLPPIDQLV